MVDSSLDGGLDQATLARSYRTKETTPEEVVSEVCRRVAAYPDPAVWIHLVAEENLRVQARDLAKRWAAGEDLPLYGLPFAVKDNIDVAGLPTTAACPPSAYVARQSAPVVGRLQQAGALVVGKTNLDQFAAGLAGDRSPYGACRNVFDPEFISGGSSAGSAVAVAAGLVSFALGTDTAGSGRVPAACNNIVGLKPTPGRLNSIEGVFPACQSLDCVSVLALTADDALAVWKVAREDPWPAPLSGLARFGPGIHAGFTFATPRDEDLEFYGDQDQGALFQQALKQLEQMGWRRSVIDFAPFRETASLLYEGPWVAERLAGAMEVLNKHPAAIHPVTRAILEGGRRFSGVEVFQGLGRLQALRQKCGKTFTRADFLVVPSVPTIPRLAAVQADSAGWSRRLGYYTNFANFLRLAGLALPAGFTPCGLPGGITLLGPADTDRVLCVVGKEWQRRLDLPLGATGRGLPSPGRPPAAAPPAPAAPGHVRIAVAGAHLRGQPLHPDLLKLGARFVRACTTAEKYRFLAFLDLAPPRPGLLHDEDRAGAVLVETYDLPMAGFGQLVASVAPPLAIGTIELADGEVVKGFLCEAWAAARAHDITDCGGWAVFREQAAGRNEQR